MSSSPLVRDVAARLETLTTEQLGLLSLPPELLTLIILHLGPVDAVFLAGSSHGLRAIACSDAAWLPRLRCSFHELYRQPEATPAGAAMQRFIEVRQVPLLPACAAGFSGTASHG